MPPRRSASSAVTSTDRDVALRLMDVSRETEERLACFIDRLRQWQTIKNLVGSSTLAHLWTRHVADSAQLVPLMPWAKRWVDLGSGAGFPGLVIAILLQGQGHPDGVVHLIESNARKCAFLLEVIRELACPAVVHNARIEAVVDTLEDVDVVTARALAPLPDLIAMGKSLWRDGASGLFLKSAAELDTMPPEQRSAEWTIIPSRTSPEGRIVMIEGLGAAGRRAAYVQQGTSSS